MSFPLKAKRELCSAQESGGKAVAFGVFSELLHRPKYTRPCCTAARLQRASSSPSGTTRFTFSALPRVSKGFNMASEPSRMTTHSSERDRPCSLMAPHASKCAARIPSSLRP